MKRKWVAFVVVVIALFMFLVPIVPFSKTVYTGLSGGVEESLPSLRCSLPSNLTYVVTPTIVYQGYESIAHYLTGHGIMVYSKCTIP